MALDRVEPGSATVVLGAEPGGRSGSHHGRRFRAHVQRVYLQAGESHRSGLQAHSFEGGNESLADEALVVGFGVPQRDDVKTAVATPGGLTAQPVDGLGAELLANRVVV